ncbi:hypothetical protein [Wolbachia endosymbiont (group A) of Conops quadrifasciatus]|uniref:hypothetical protein n=1 Tax=Wolbachia endosymbiont (group A) of Conops quadrifasciatus TaxID=3066143 RepID=UPI003133038F
MLLFCFGVGAGLVALGVTSPIAISVVTLIAHGVVVELVSKITERFSSPPTPPSGLVDSGVKVNGASAGCVPSPSH